MKQAFYVKTLQKKHSRQIKIIQKILIQQIIYPNFV